MAAPTKPPSKLVRPPNRTYTTVLDAKPRPKRSGFTKRPQAAKRMPARPAIAPAMVKSANL